MVRFATLVLAGGQSRRMGRDKALLTLPLPHRPTLLQQVCHVAQHCGPGTASDTSADIDCPDVYVITSWPDRYEPFLPKTVTLLRETSGGSGPLVAFAQGWGQILNLRQQQRQSPPDWLLLLACDMPALDSKVLTQWQRHLSAVEESVIAVLPRRLGRWEPLCGFYHRRCIPSLEAAITQNIRSFQRWLAQETVVPPVGAADSHLLQNCNTPAEWQHFLGSMEGRNL